VLIVSEISRDFGWIPKKAIFAPHLLWISVATSMAGIAWVVNKPCSICSDESICQVPGFLCSSAASIIRRWDGCTAHAGAINASGVICPS